MLKIDDLVGYKNRKIYQDTDYFCFSVDAVLLANFVSLNKKVINILEIGTGNAPIPLILTLRKNNLKIDAVEIQKSISNIAKKSVKLNKLENNIRIINDDILKYYKGLDGNTYDMILCNPPYFKKDMNHRISPNDKRAMARHELTIFLEDYFLVSKKLLKSEGYLCMIHRTERLNEIMNLFNKYHITPSRIQFIYSHIDKKSELFLVEGIKAGNKKLEIEKPFVQYTNDGSPTNEYKLLLTEVKRSDYDVTKEL